MNEPPTVFEMDMMRREAQLQKIACAAVAYWMIEKGYSPDGATDLTDLMNDLIAQVREKAK